jgi:hypothetical protein
MHRSASATQLDMDSSCPPTIGGRVIGGRTLHRMSRHLLAARIAAGLTQALVASRMGTTASVISRLENAAGRRPTLTTLERYAQAVGCSLEIRLVPLP